MTIERLEQRAREAMQHPEVAPVFDGLPKSYRNNPALLRRLLMAVAEGHPISQSPAYERAHAALAAVEETRALVDPRGFALTSIFIDIRCNLRLGSANETLASTYHG